MGQNCKRSLTSTSVQLIPDWPSNRNSSSLEIMPSRFLSALEKTLISSIFFANCGADILILECATWGRERERRQVCLLHSSSWLTSSSAISAMTLNLQRKLLTSGKYIKFPDEDNYALYGCIIYVIGIISTACPAHKSKGVHQRDPTVIQKS